MTLYDQEFFARNREGSYRSARVVVPIVVDLARPKSVVDVGCGLARWLKVFKDHGVEETLGLDGDYVDLSQICIPVDEFLPTDLTRPLDLPRKFDLAVSLEVAEHLPTSRARSFVADLTRLAPVVLFSAAIPCQEGTGHINEQWQEYWAGMFEERGFSLIDAIRPRIWDNGQVEWWYAQNCFIYVERSFLERSERLRHARDVHPPLPLNLVHPRKFLSTQFKIVEGETAALLRRWVPEGSKAVLVDDDRLVDEYRLGEKVVRLKPGWAASSDFPAVVVDAGAEFALVTFPHLGQVAEMIDGNASPRPRRRHRDWLVELWDLRPLEPPLLLELHPSTTVAGVRFNLQPTGLSALAVTCKHATPASQVVFGVDLLETEFGNSTFLTALVPPELYARPGQIPVHIKNDDEESSNELVFRVR